MNAKKLQQIPQVEQILQDPLVLRWEEKIGRPFVVMNTRDVLQQTREQGLTSGTIPEYSVLVSRIELLCEKTLRKRTRPVINCTGVVIHTNLGRAPLEQECWEAASKLNCGYTNLEFDLDTGRRGNRHSAASALFSRLTGAESALVVNNNAAALHLLLSTFAPGKEVLISRGELVQIGGGFRIPEILELSGARLVEIGTTNITTTQDYLEHITENTAMVLQVHRSNFSIRGFTASPSVKELSSRLPRTVMLACDQGSGAFTQDIPGELSMRSLIEQGADLVTCSGDKLLGSVQAGCIAGKEDLIQAMAQHPLYRVLRPGKTVISLLEEALVRRLNGLKGIPVSACRASRDEQSALGGRIIRGMDRKYVKVVDAPYTLGGGSTPDEFFPGRAVELSLKVPESEVQAFLRDLDTPIIAQTSKKSVLLHLAAVKEQDTGYIREAIKKAMEQFACTS